MSQLLQVKQTSVFTDNNVQCFGECGPSASVVQQLELVWHPYATLKWAVADETARYITGYFMRSLSDNLPAPLCHEMEGTLGFVANELLENAIKFHFNHFLPVSCVVQQGAEEFVIQVCNSVDPARLPRFIELINLLLTHDPASLFIQHMENNLEELNDSSSGLGMIMILNDYNGKLGWKFQSLLGLPGLPPQITVTTVARLPIPKF